MAFRIIAEAEIFGEILLTYKCSSEEELSECNWAQMSLIIIIHMDNSFKWHNIGLFENTFLQDM